MDLTLGNSWLGLSVEQRRAGIQELEQKCLQLEDTCKAEVPLEELHCNGIYARTVHITKGTCLVGKIHLTDQINVVSKGAIQIATDDGLQVIRAPSIFISKAGVKRAGYALEDTTWTEFLATDKTNSDDIEEEFIVNDYEELDRRLENK